MEKRVSNKYVILGISGIIAIYIVDWLNLDLSGEANSLINIGLSLFALIMMCMDHGLIKKTFSDQDIFSIWWVLFIPLYLFRRARFLKQGWSFFIISLLAILIPIGFAYYADVENNKIRLQETACNVVTDILKDNLFTSGITCSNLQIYETKGSMHYALVELSNGNFVETTIRELDDGRIYVKIEN